MSYPRGLDEYDEDELKEELEQRRKLRDKGLCDYCRRFGNSDPCRFPERHAVARQRTNGCEEDGA